MKGAILKLLMEHKVLNTMQICRLLNGHTKDGSICYRTHNFGANRFSKHNHHWCHNEQVSCCKIDYSQVYSTLLGMKTPKSRKMRFFDHGGIGSDVFRFWYLDEKNFEERVLRQTLIPYVGVSVEEEKK